MTSTKHAARPMIVTQRLRAEPVELRHASAMARLLDDPRIYAFLPEDPPSRERLERQYAFLEGGKSPDGQEQWLTWILLLHDRPEDPIGFLQATIEAGGTARIAYVLHPAHFRRGYAREATSALIDLLFEHYRVARTVAEMDSRNQASIALVRALGFRYVSTARVQLKGEAALEHLYELIRS